MNIVTISEDQLEKLILKTVKAALLDFKFEQTDHDVKLLDIKEAAEYLRLKPATIYGLTSTRAIPFLKLKKKVYFKEVDLLNYLEAGRKSTYSEIAETAVKNLKEK